MPCNADVRTFALPSEEVDGTWLALKESGDHAAAVIIDMNPVPDSVSISLDYEGMIMESGFDPSRDHIAAMLPRTVIVRAAGDHDVLFPVMGGGETEKVGGGLRSGGGCQGFERVYFY